MVGHDPEKSTFRIGGTLDDVSATLSSPMESKSIRLRVPDGDLFVGSFPEDDRPLGYDPEDDPFLGLFPERVLDVASFPEQCAIVDGRAIV